MRQAKTVYFMGAGASKDAGVPLTGELLRLVAKKGQGASKLLTDFISIFGNTATNTTGRPPIIELLSLLDSSLRTSQPLDRTFNISKLKRIRDELMGQLISVIRASCKRGQTVKIPWDALDQPFVRGLKLAGYYRTFVRHLRPYHTGPSMEQSRGDSIITTNYDTNLDVAFYEIAYWDVSKNGPSFSEILDVNLGSDFRDPYTDEFAFTSPEKAMNLLKLHGSLNWLYCPRCTRAYVAAFGMSVWFATRQKRSTKVKNELTCHCGYYGLDPIIIAPSVFQDITNPHLQNIWMYALHLLEHADRWVFIGYSLPDEDLTVRSLLYRAMSANNHRKRENLAIEVVCPRKFVRGDVGSRYRKFFGKKVNFHEMGFRQYVERFMNGSK